MNFKEFERKAYRIFADIIARNFPSKDILEYECQNWFSFNVEDNYEKLLNSIGHLAYLIGTTKNNLRRELEYKIYDKAYENLTGIKHKEYSNDDDVFSNFEAIRIVFQSYPYEIKTETVMKVLGAKHYNWIDKHRCDLENVNEDSLIEHFGDTINYLILIYLYGESYVKR